MRDEEWRERLSQTWHAAGVGSPPKMREQRAWQPHAGAQEPSVDVERGPLPWRNPGDRHDPHGTFEEHTIASAQHAAAALARHQHSPARARPSTAASPSKRDVCPALVSGSCSRVDTRGLSCAADPDEVAAWLESLFGADDTERRRLRRAAVKSAGLLRLLLVISVHGACGAAGCN
jgi:hypothetical protein